MFRLLRLEDRIVLDGVAMYDMLDEMADHDAHDHQMAGADADAQDHANDGGFEFNDPLDAGALDAVAPDDGGLHVLLVSSDVKGADALADAAKVEVGVVVRIYDAADTLDGLSGIINEALGGQKADSIAIAAHNVNGAQVQLTRGDTASLDSLDTGPQMDFWKGIGGYLAEDGRIDLLSCDVAGAENGDAFLAKLEVVAGAKVAASTDATGNDAVGGDWVLEKYLEGDDEVNIQKIYFDAVRLEKFEDTLYAGQDPDPGYNDIYDRTVPSGKYTFIPVPTDTWQDPQGTASVSLSFSGAPSWLRYSASSEGFWALKPAAGASATVMITATDGVNSVQDPFTVSAYDNGLAAPAYADITTPFSVSEDAVSGTVVPAAGYQTATDNGSIVDYEIVSGNPTNGTTFGFAIDGTGDIVVSDGSLINYDDPYVVNNTHQLVVRAEDNDGIYAFSTVEIPMIQGAVDFVVDLNVSPTFLQEDPAGSNTAQITVSISPTPTSAVTINLDFQGTGADQAVGPGAAAGDDYNVTATTLNFTAGESSKVITLTVADDGVNEPNETFTVDVVDPGLPNYSVAAGTLTTLTITDDVKPTVGLNLDPVSFGENSTATLTASLAGGVTVSTETAVTLTFGGTAVHGTAADPGVNDYTGAEVIIIPAGTASASITLTGVVDNIDEGGSEAFNVSVADLPANTFDIDPAAGTVNGSVTDVIVELPVVQLTANRASFSEGETFQVTANLVDSGGAPFAAPAGGINVILDTTGGNAIKVDDFQVPSTISIAEGFTSNSVTVFGVADGVTEGNETVGVAVGANPTVYNVGSSPFTVLLKDVVTPVVTLEGGGTIAEDPAGTTIVRAVQSTTTLTSTTVTLGIAGNPAADQGDDYAAVYTSDGTPVATTPGGDWTVVIPAGDTDAGIKFTAIKDDVFDGDVNEQIVLTAKSAGTSLVGAVDTATVEIVDADAGDIPVVSLFVKEGTQLVSGGSLDEIPGAILNGQVKLALGEVPPVPVTVYLTPSDLTGDALAEVDYALFSDAGATVTIPMEDIGGGVMGWALKIDTGFNKTNFFVAGLGDDNVFEGTESFDLAIADVVNGTVGSADTITASVLDGTTPPVISLAISPNAVQEQEAFGTHEATVTIDLTPAPGTTFGTGEVSVSLAQIGDGGAGFTAATEDEDYALFEADGVTPLTIEATNPVEWSVAVDLTGAATASGSFVLQGQADELNEGTEGFELEASIGTSVDSVTGTIIDGAAADPLDVTLEAITTTSVTEGVGSAQVDFTLSRVYNADLVVTLDFGGDADPDADYYVEYADGTLTVQETVGADGLFEFTIAEGSGTAAGFVVKAVNDGVFEGDEDFSITIGTISADSPPNTFSSNVETVTIVDGQPQPELSLYWKDAGGNPIDTVNLAEGGNKFLYAALSSPAAENVVVGLEYTAPADGAEFDVDYTGSATVTILAGNLEGKTLIFAKDDPLYELTPETFNVTISGFTGPVQDVNPDQVTGIIDPSDLDGEVQVTLEWQDTGSLTEGNTGEDSVIVQLDRNTHTTPVVVTLDFTAAPTAAVGDAEFGNDYDVEAGTTIDGAGQIEVTIAVGATQASIPLVAVDDLIAEPPTEGFTVSITDVTGGVVAGNFAQEFETQELTGVINDNEPSPSISIELLNSADVSEGGGLGAAAQFRAVIDNGVVSTEDITVTLDVITGTFPGDAAQGTDFNVAPADFILTIPAGESQSGILDDTAGGKILRVIPQDDGTFEGPETLQIGVTEAVGAISGANFTVDPAVQDVTIVDDDPFPVVSLDPGTAIIAEDSGGSSTITLSLVGNSFSDVVVTLQLFDISDGGIDTDYDLFVDGTAVTAGDLTGDQFTYTFPGGAAGTVGIDVVPINDGTIEGDESLSVRIVDVTNATIGTAENSVVTITDDDFPTVYVDLDFIDTVGNNSPNVEISEDYNVFGARTGKLDINLVDDLGDPATLPVGSDAIVTLDFFSEAVANDGVVVDFDFEIATDQFFSVGNILTVSTTGELEVVVPADVGTTSLYIRGYNDVIYEGDEGLEIAVLRADNAEVTSAQGDILVTGTVLDDEDPPTVIVEAVDPAGVTEGLTTEFTVTFQDRSSVDIEVTLDIGGDATLANDYTLEVEGVSFTVTGGQLLFTAPATDLESAGASFTILAKTTDDSLYETDESIILSIGTGADFTAGTPGTATTLILNDDEAPIVQLGAAVPTQFAEDTETAQITVNLVDNLGNPVTTGADTLVTIDFGGAATPAETAPVVGDDYTVLVDGGAVTFTDANTLEVTIAAGDTQATLTLDGQTDVFYEGDEDITVSIVDATGAVPSTPAEAVNETVTILEDDNAPDVNIYWDAAAFNEDGDSNTLFAAFAGGATIGVDTLVTVNFSGGTANYTPGAAFTAGDDVTDADSNSNVITIKAGQNAGSLILYGISDDKYEADTITGVSGEVLEASIASIDIAGASGSIGATALDTAVILDDPTDIPKVTLDVATTSVTEGDSTVITVTRDKTAPVETVVDIVFTSAGADPVEDGDFSVDGNAFSTAAATFTVTVTIPVGADSITVPFEAVADAQFEGDETVSIEIDPTQNGTLGAATSATVTIIDDGGATPVVSLVDQAAGGTPGDSVFAEQVFKDGAATIPDTASFTVALDSAAFDDRSITLQLDGLANSTVGTDFTVDVDPDGTFGPAGFAQVTVENDGTFSFTLPQGATTADVVFTGVEDAFYETPESLTVSIADAYGLQVTTSGADTFTYTLIDDDPAPVVELSLNSSELPEDGGATSLFALLKDPVTGDAYTAGTDIIVEVTYGGDATLDATLNADYTTTAKQFITIAAGSNKSAPVFIETVNDEVYEGNEEIVVSVVDVVNAATSTGFADTVTATIIEDEQGPTVSLTVDTTSIPEADGEAALTLSLSFTSPVDEVVWVNFSTTDDDSIGDGPEDVWGTEARYDENYDLWPEDYLATTSSGSEFAGLATIPIGDPLNVTSVPATGNDAFAITIPAGDSSVTVYLHALDDNGTGNLFGIADGGLYEKDETFTVSIDDNSFPNNLKADTANDSATVTIVDDDPAPLVTLAWTAGTDGKFAEDGVADPFAGSIDVTIDGPTNQFIQVTLDFTGQPADYTVGATNLGTLDDNGDGTFTITFPTAAGAQTAQVDFNIVDDPTYEVSETFTAAIQDVLFADIGTPDFLTGVITDEEDVPSITVGISTDGTLIPEGTQGVLTEGDVTPGPDALFIIDKGGVTTPQPVLVDYVISGTVTDGATDGVDFSAITSGTLTLARDFDAIATVDVSVLGDDLDEADENVIITISNARFSDGTPIGNAIDTADDTATLTILDDDASPTVAMNDGAVVSEGDFGVITDADLFYTDADSSEGVITGVTNGDLILNMVTAPVNGTLYQGTPGDFSSAVLNPGDTFFQSELISGNIWYQHDDSETTSDEFSYIVSDKPLTDSDVNTTDGIFTITVDPVNDAPTVESIVFWIQENTTGEVSSLIDLSGDGLIASDQDGNDLSASTITIGNAAFSLDTTTAGEVRLSVGVDMALDYEFQSSHALLVNVDDGTAPAKDVLVIVNVKDDVSEPDPFAAGTIPTPEDLMSDTQWTFQIPDTVFPDGTQVTYIFSETGGLETSPWLHFEAESLTFWYDPAVTPGPTADQVYDIEITAFYWHQNNVIKGVSQQSFELNYDYIAGLQRSREVFEALDFLDSEDGEGFLPGDGDAMEIQEMMVAGAAPAEMPQAMEVPVDYELSEVLALLEGDPLIIDLETEIQEQMA